MPVFFVPKVSRLVFGGFVVEVVARDTSPKTLDQLDELKAAPLGVRAQDGPPFFVYESPWWARLFGYTTERRVALAVERARRVASVLNVYAREESEEPEA